MLYILALAPGSDSEDDLPKNAIPVVLDAVCVSYQTTIDQLLTMSINYSFIKSQKSSTPTFHETAILLKKFVPSASSRICRS